MALVARLDMTAVLGIDKSELQDPALLATILDVWQDLHPQE